jgi:hypothetical protein
VDFARELIKPHRIIHYLWHTAWPDGQNRYQATEQAVRAVGMELQSRGIAEMSELDAAVAAIKMSGSPAFIVQPSPFTYGHRGSIIALAQIVEVRTSRGVSRVMLFSKAIIQAE